MVNRCFVVSVDAFVYSPCTFFSMCFCHFLPLPCVTAIRGENPIKKRFFFFFGCYFFICNNLFTNGAACTFLQPYIKKIYSHK